MTLTGVRYTGGKSGLKPTGKWVAALVPYGHYYIEPFAGMLGVLLQRVPSSIEIVNDLDGNVTNWWQVVRDKPDDLLKWMEHTPAGRRTFYELAKRLGESNDDVERAGAFAYVLSLSYLGTGATYSNAGVNSAHPWRGLRNRIEALAARLGDVMLENTCALDLLERFVQQRSAVIYCDPPYPRTTTPGLSTGEAREFDYGAMCELLRTAEARVAVSGLADSGYELPGWHRFERNVPVLKGNHSRAQPRRVETLWTNYPISSNTLF